MRYRIEFAPRAARQFTALPRQMQLRIQRKIETLATNPRPRGTAELTGSEGFLRIRVAEYRLIYLVEDDRLLILIVKIGHRREVYRRH